MQNNTFDDENSGIPKSFLLDCIKCLYLESTKLRFTGISGNANSLIEIVTIPQLPATLIFNDLTVDGNSFGARDFKVFSSL